MAQETSHILYNRVLKNGYYKIGLTCGPGYSNAAPGQFVTLKIGTRMDPLLRRPFSIHRLIRKHGIVSGLEILYRVVGGFTTQLSEMKENETIDLLGPLGHGFTVTADLKNSFLAAGGIGVAPIVFLAESLGAKGIDLSNTPVFLGGRTESDILCEEDFDRLGMPVYVTTDDGSLGQKGVATEPLQALLGERRPDIIYACGPHGMLHALSKIAAKHDIRCEVSIETVMACGIGICMGCAVETKNFPEGYRHICKDGPVFDASVVVF